MPLHHDPTQQARRQSGLVLLAVLLFILVTTLAANTLVSMHATQNQRAKEAELLFVGGQYRRAIASYYNAVPPGGARSYPPTLDALLIDDRFPKPVHHLRRLYPDPMTGQPDWELVKEGSGLTGVKSRSNRSTLKKRGFREDDQQFESKELYSEWVFGLKRQ